MKTYYIDINTISFAPWNTRAEITEASVRDLAESIKASGLLSPINVIERGGKYICFDGNRRLAACRAAKMAKIAANIWDITDDEAKVKTVTANLQREADDPLLVARLVCERIDAGETIREIGAALGKSDAWVSRRAKLVTLADEVKELATKYTLDALECLAELPKQTQAKVIKTTEPRAAYLGRLNSAQIRDDINRASRDLDDAPFCKCGGAAAEKCRNCPNRTGAQPDLFAVVDGKLGRCLDEKCYKAAENAHINAQIAAKVKAGTEIVRVNYAWEIPSEAKATRPTKDSPCAYVHIYNGEVSTLKFGTSKKAIEAEKKAKAAKAEAERKEGEAERERERGIVNRFVEYMRVDANAAKVRKDISAAIVKNAKARNYALDLVESTMSDIWDSEDFAALLRAFPFVAKECGIDADDAEWILGNNPENENENE